MCPGGWLAWFCHTAFSSFGPSGLCEYLSPLASKKWFPCNIFFPSIVTEALTGCNFVMLFRWFYLPSRAPCPNRHWHISSSSQSPRCKAHLRHSKIRVMKYAAHWQRHQSHDSKRTDNKGKEGWNSSKEKRGWRGKKSTDETQLKYEIVMWSNMGWRNPCRVMKYYAAIH